MPPKPIEKKKEVTISTPDTKTPARTNDSATTGAETKDQSYPISPVSREANRALSGGLADAIVDIKITANEKQETEISRNGYVQLFQEDFARVKRTGAAQGSTFGNKCSLWMWRRNQGTCSGRLKPIVDIQLSNLGVSSDFVLSGYTCESVSISGQWVWIKRATSSEEEKDAIVDLYITTGRMKDTSDPIWQSPGIGWLRVDGNFTKSTFGSSLDTILWMRPARTRSSETHMASPVRSAQAMPEEVRYAKLLSEARLALRHFVRVEDMKRLATLLMDSTGGGNASTSNMVRSERVKDFTDLFHKSGARGGLSLSAFTKMLTEAGLKMAKPDLILTFNLFDTKQTGRITIEEFSDVLSLTDYELDLALEKIRIHLLKAVVPSNTDQPMSGGNRSGYTAMRGKRGLNPAMLSKANSGVLGGAIASHNLPVGTHLIKESATLAQVFLLINSKDDGIMSLDETLDLAAKVEVFVSEEEARRMQHILDVDGNDRVEESDFIAFMTRDSQASINKSFRVRESSCTLRRWLVRGTNEKVGTTTTITASAQQWAQFKVRYEKLLKKKFPGFLGPQVLMITMANLGFRLSALEARELTLLVAPEKNGRIHQADLHGFMDRDLRSFGELLALLERELFKELIDAFRRHYRHEQREGREDVDLSERFRKLTTLVRKEVESVYDKPPEGADPSGGPGRADADPDDDEGAAAAYAPAPLSKQRTMTHNTSTASHEVISIVQLKDGLESYFKTNKYAKEVPENQFPNLEEWAALSVLVQADIAEGDVYGVRLRSFLESMCYYAVTMADELRLKRNGGTESVEIVARDLQRQINIEARSMATQSRYGAGAGAGVGSKGFNYKAVFNLFDEDRNGAISAKEFQLILKRFQLVRRLADHQLPELIKMFTLGKKEDNITLEEFERFARQGMKGSSGAGFGDDDDDLLVSRPNPDTGDGFPALDDAYEDEDDIEDMTSNVPPVVITRNAECDWLLWFLYREALKIDPLDPESVITDLQVRCSETEITLTNPSISVKEMWHLLFELGLQGGMTHEQFVRGVLLVCERSTGKDDDRVDFEALCRYVVRMGRAFNSLCQERAKADEGRFGPLMAELKEFFSGLADEKPEAGEALGAPRFEKLFRRMDGNGDGMITAKEFKNGLRHLRYNRYKEWTMRLVRRLFDECDRNKDGLLSIKEFTNFILERSDPRDKRLQLTLPNGEADLNGTGRSDMWGLSDDEDDDIFYKSKSLSDHQLLRKVSDVLMDIVPVDPQYPGQHADVVRGSVRRFFQRADPDHKGTVSEERFRAFLRRSGLQDHLTAAELRRLTEKLKRHRKLGGVVIEYERLVQQLFVAVESVPRSKAESVMTRLQEAANASAASGRSFISLCSLIDLRLTGHISREELMHTCKMMDCPLSSAEVEALLELLPNQAISADKTIDYRILQNVLMSFTPRDTKAYDIEPRFNATASATGALPAYASSPGAATRVPPPLPDRLHDPAFSRTLPGQVNTPLGYRLDTPYPDFNSNDPLNSTRRQMNLGATGGGGGGGGASNGAYERIVRLIVDRVRVGIEEKSRAWGAPFSLRRQFEVFDRDSQGIVSVRTFQSTLEDIGVSCSPSDLQAVYHLYGRPEDDRIRYDAFCASVDAGGAGYGTLAGGGGGKVVGSSIDGVFGGGTFRDVQMSANAAYPYGTAASPGVGLDSRVGIGMRGTGNLMGAGTLSNTAGASYLNHRVLQRYVQLKQQGNHPREFFAAQDFDRTGMLWTNRFTNVITRLQLLQTEHQLSSAIEDFSSISNRAMVMYEDFLDALERAVAAQEGNPRLSMIGSGRAAPFVNGSGFDGLASDGYGGTRYSSDRRGQPQQSDDNSSQGGLRDSYNRLRSSNSGWASIDNYQHGMGIGVGPDADDGSDIAPLSMPKVSDSASFHRSSLHRASSPGRYRSSDSGGFGPITSSTPRSSASRIQAPYASPSRVGSKMWGSHTPLGKKGRAPIVGEDKWCCSVCLYVENPVGASTCAVCDTPNYNTNKGYQVKEQCRNCTFLNGQFADECEMCGEPLSGGAGKKSHSSAGKFLGRH